MPTDLATRTYSVRRLMKPCTSAHEGHAGRSTSPASPFDDRRSDPDPPEGSRRSRTRPLPEGRAHLRFRRPVPGTRRPGRSGVDTNASTSAALVPCGIRALHFATVGTSPTARHRMSVAVTWPGSTLERAPLRSNGARLRPRGPNRPAARPCRARCRGFDSLPLPTGSRPESGAPCDASLSVSASRRGQT